MSEPFRTEIGHATADEIVVRGRNLATDVMGRMPFADLAFLLASGRPPTEGESVVFNAVLASLADHGLTPSALAARLTHMGAPEAIQGSIAAGLLGAGSVFLGPVEDTARFLAEILEGFDDPDDEDALREGAEAAVREAREAGRRIPGLGHPIHRDGDPRTPRLYELATENGVAGPNLRLLGFIAEAHREASGKALPINGAGAAGAVLADLGFPPHLNRGFALLARVAGLIGHIAEEATDPIAPRLWNAVEGR